MRAQSGLLHTCREAACVLLAILLAAPSAGQTSGAVILACATDRNPSLLAYTFDMTVAMRMRHFPWLPLHMSGTGRFVRGQSYVVKFSQEPAFAKIQTIDLSALDPSMWQREYSIQFAGSDSGLSSFILRPLRVDSRDGNALRDALVTLDDRYATRSVEYHYRSGDIRMNVTPAAVQDYRLPGAGAINVNLRGSALSGSANFSNYATIRDAKSSAIRTWEQCATGIS